MKYMAFIWISTQAQECTLQFNLIYFYSQV